MDLFRYQVQRSYEIGPIDWFDAASILRNDQGIANIPNYKSKKRWFEVLRLEWIDQELSARTDRTPFGGRCG